MSKKLVIVESPAKAKTIGKFLGRNYQVKASMGHVRDLPKSQIGVDVDNDFEPKYITIRGKGDVLKELRTAAKKADKVFLATDPDREGEAIAWHLVHALKLQLGAFSRVEFNEITKNTIQNAIKNSREIDIHRVEAQQARRLLDRLVGYQLSPLLWRKIKKGLSAGRVQSVAVRLICDREEEINEFISEEYWTLEATFLLDKNNSLVAKLVKEGKENISITSKEEMDKVIDNLNGADFVVSSIKTRQKVKKPSPPFITSSLQQEAYKRLGYTAKKTMMIAQQLYEGLDLGKEGSVGLITYIRTDSVRISDEAISQAREFIVTEYGEDYLPKEPRVFATKKKAQDAHEAIRPTSIVRTPDSVKPFLSRDQLRLYRLIWERFVATQMSDQLLETTSLEFKGKDYIFRASGSVVKFIGFAKVYNDNEKAKDNLLPEVQEGQQVKIETLDPKQHFTQPPARYTDASLIKTLEELGIGRPSTYAPIVDTIQKRGYIVKEDKQFYPTELGSLVIDMLKEHFPRIIDIEFTAELEDSLDQIEEGKEEWNRVLGEFYYPFEETLKKADEAIGKIEVEDEVTDEPCPECGEFLVVKFGRYGKFLACPSFPDCTYTKPLLEATGVKCPQCEEGEVVIRRSKKGRVFYGCSNYPECEFVSWERPTEKKCPLCNSYLVSKQTKKGNYVKCSNKECGFKEDIKEV